MDCEGAEHPILLDCPGDTLKKISRAAIEVHVGPEASQTMPALADDISSHGFEIEIKGSMLHFGQRGSAS